MKPMRVGLVGCGRISDIYLKNCTSFEAIDIVACASLDIAESQAKADQYGIARACVPEDIYADNDIDCVLNLTIPAAHAEVSFAALNAGKHVLVEKPISDSVDDAKAIIDLAHEKGLVLQVGHIERFNPVMSQLEERLDHPKFIECHRLSPFPQRSLDIGVVLDLMIHDLEIVLHLVNSPVASVDAVGIPVLTRREDIANARIRFENGCVANITASRISPERMRKIRVFQSDAYLSLDYQDQSGWIYRKDGMEIGREQVEVEKDEPLKCELAAFVECAAKGETPKVSGQQGADALDVALEITRLIEADNQ